MLVDPAIQGTTTLLSEGCLLPSTRAACKRICSALQTHIGWSFRWLSQNRLFVVQRLLRLQLWRALHRLLLMAVKRSLDGHEPGLRADSVNATPSVRRVVLTSSVAAVYGDPDERGQHHLFTEADWALAPKEQYIPY